MDRYLVVGHPIAHSKSPLIHSMFSKQTGEQIEYQTQDIAPGEFNQRMEQLFADGLKGANVTVPFKTDAFQWADRLTDRARMAGAVNTLIPDQESDQRLIVGDNTDGVGMINDITRNLGGELSGKRVLIVGAGGAVRGVLQPLIECAPSEIVVVNRTLARADALKADFAEIGKMTTFSFVALFEAQLGPFDWVINGTSTGLSGDCPPLPDSVISAQSCCYDMFYSDQDTPFNAWCKSRGAERCYDGLGMLVEQAAEAFRVWRGVRPESEPVIKALRKHI